MPGDPPTATTSTDPRNDLTDDVVALLKAILPPTWQLTRRSAATGAPEPGDDAVLDLRAGSSSLTLLVEARQSFTPRDVDAVLGGRAISLRRLAGEVPVLIVAPWLSERTRQRIVEAGFNYADLAGNVRLSAQHLPIFIERTTAANPPKARQTEPALRGPKAGRIVRLLADVAPPYTVLDLARAAEVSPAYVSRLLERLDRDALVERGRRGVVVAVDWSSLLRRRAEVYSLLGTNKVERYVCANGPGWALEAASDLALPDLTLTGSFAAEQIVSVAAPTLLTLYATGGVAAFVDLARLLPADQGANVLILTPQDASAVGRPSTWLTAPLPPKNPIVACSQLALDCLSGPGRMPAEGEALLSWMAENEGKWRSSALATVGEASSR
jgi:DNA-binding transcriptional ArsR family regulator